MGRDITDSPVRGQGSPRRRSPSRRERSPVRHRSSHKASSPPREKSLSRTKSPRHEKLRSPEKSPSPRTNRLRRVQAERDSEKVNEKEHRRDRDDERVAQRERDTERQVPSERKEGRLERDKRETEKVSKKELRRDRDWEDERAAHRESGIERQVPSERKERRLERDQRESEKVSAKEHRGDRDWEDERAAYRERDRDRQVPIERKERRSGMDEVDRGFSRSKHERSPSPSYRHQKSRRRSRSPHRDTDMTEVMESRGAENRNGDIDSVAKMKAAEEALATKEKEKPSFELSGKLAAETNRVRGVTLLFNEPPDAKKPDIRWRLYVFKGGEVLNEPLYVHRQSYYLFGRERRVADIPTDHPSCSKQHAVLQYRQVEKEQPDGTMLKQVRPYVMDLGSTNGTFINDNRLEPQRYYELLEKDTIKFGNSSREYVLLHENSAN